MINPKAEKNSSIFLYLTVTIFLILTMFVVGEAKDYFLDNRISKANNLHVSNSVELIRGNIDNVVVAPDRLYTNVEGQGVFSIARQLSAAVPVEWKKLVEQLEPVYLQAVSQDGESGIILSDTGIKIINLRSLQTVSVNLISNQNDKYFADVCWSGDGKTIYVVEQNIVKDQDISLLKNSDKKLFGSKIKAVDIATGVTKEITDGTSPSIALSGSIMVFERNGEIWSRDLKKGQDKQLAVGRFPAISPNGRYVAYIQNSELEIESSSKASGIFEEVYIFSLDNPKDKLKVSSNFLIKESENGTDNFLPYYKYYDPVWDKDSQTIFVVKKEANGYQAPSINRYQLAKIANEPRAVVNGFLQGRISKNNEILNRNMFSNLQEDYINYYSDALGYSFEDSGWKDNGLFAEVRKQYVKNEGKEYKVINEQVYLENGIDGYKVKNATSQLEFTCMVKPDGIYQGEQNKEEKVVEIVNEQPVLVGYNIGQHKVVYLVPNENLYEIRFYDKRNSKTDIIPSLIEYNARLMNMTFSAHGQIMAVQYNYQGKNQMAIYNLQDMKRIYTPFLEDIEKAYWAGNNMVIYTKQERFVFRWDYNPGAGSVSY